MQSTAPLIKFPTQDKFEKFTLEYCQATWPPTVRELRRPPPCLDDGPERRRILGERARELGGGRGPPSARGRASADRNPAGAVAVEPGAFRQPDRPAELAVAAPLPCTVGQVQQGGVAPRTLLDRGGARRP